MQLSGKVAMVTGAASGIGKAIAELFAEQQAKVVLLDWNERGEAVAAQIRDRGGEALFCRADVSQAAEVEAAVAATVKCYGKLNVLVNNAAVQIMRPLIDTTDEDWDRIHSVNLKGIFHGCKYAIPAMIQAGGGSIVNMSSGLALVGDPDLPAYGAAKGGILSLTKSIAIAYGPSGVRANAICPGDVNTPMVQDYFNNSPDPDSLRREVCSKYALRRIAEPREIAQVAAFLASDASSFMTGSILVVDGGLLSKCY